MRNKGNADIHRIHAGIRGVKKLDASAFGSVKAWEGNVFRRVFECDERGGRELGCTRDSEFIRVVFGLVGDGMMS